VFLDRLLQDVTAPAADEMLVVVAEPGRIATITRGAMAVSGKGAAAKVDLEARTIDIAPTLLHILGLPISRELAGRPVLDVLDREIAARFSVRQVDTYGRRRSPAGLREGQPLDREMIERLRSLGYVR
jgi:hypothetical protein